MRITVADRHGVCRWCRCTDAHGCEKGCAWANRAHTLCTECVSLDTLVRSQRGRRELALVLQDYAEDALIAVETSR